MIRLFYIKFYDDKGQTIVRKDYTGLQFASEELTNKFIDGEKKIFETYFDMKLKLNPHHREVPDITIKQLIESYAKVMNQDYEDVTGKTRKREVVNTRMFITKTALSLGFVHGQLRPFFKDGVTYHYESTMDDLIQSEDMIHTLWKGYEKKVMQNFINIRYEDGSGQLV